MFSVPSVLKLAKRLLLGAAVVQEHADSGPRLVFGPDGVPDWARQAWEVIQEDTPQCPVLVWKFQEAYFWNEVLALAGATEVQTCFQDYFGVSLALTQAGIAEVIAQPHGGARFAGEIAVVANHAWQCLYEVALHGSFSGALLQVGGNLSRMGTDTVLGIGVPFSFLNPRVVAGDISLAVFGHERGHLKRYASVCDPMNGMAEEHYADTYAEELCQRAGRPDLARIHADSRLVSALLSPVSHEAARYWFNPIARDPVGQNGLGAVAGMLEMKLVSQAMPVPDESDPERFAGGYLDGPAVCETLSQR